MAYSPGKIKATCDRCGFEYPLSQLRKEYTGLMVCSADYDPRPPYYGTPDAKPEGVPHPNARPDNQVDNSPNLTTAQDLGSPAVPAPTPTPTPTPAPSNAVTYEGETVTHEGEPVTYVAE